MSAEIISIPPHAAAVLAALEHSGFEAWCVGGCVRDSLLSRAPTDWDLTTSAPPDEILSSCADFRTIPTGVRHGTVTVISSGLPIEVTTFRRDSDYTDHRHPSSVKFSRNLDDDLSRRDFTVNAMAYHPTRGLIDRFGGQADLRNKILRCVGNPRLRFTEDSLRILRCIRFASTLGFTIESATSSALFECAPLLENISRERVRDELTKLLCGPRADEILRRYAQIIFTVLPQLAPMSTCAQETPYHCFNVWEHTLHALASTPADPTLRWAVFLHDCGKPSSKTCDENGIAHFRGHDSLSAQIAAELLKNLRFSNREIDEITALIAHHGERPPLPENRIKRLLAALGQQQTFRLFALMKADLSAKPPHLFNERITDIETCENTARQILSRAECLSLKNLAVNGRDLQELGFAKGPQLGAALNSLLSAVLDGTLANTREALLSYARKILSE